VRADTKAITMTPVHGKRGLAAAAAFIALSATFAVAGSADAGEEPVAQNVSIEIYVEDPAGDAPLTPTPTGGTGTLGFSGPDGYNGYNGSVRSGHRRRVPAGADPPRTRVHDLRRNDRRSHPTTMT
jgi:hypothetical protein